MSLDRDQAMEVLKAFGKAFNKGDVDAILECVTDDFEWRLNEGPEAPDGRVVRGREEVRRTLAERAALYNDVRFSETEVFFADDQVIGRFRATGSHADGRPLDVRGVDIYSFRDGKIAVKDSYWKDIG
ncbi:MAG: nuclear transport factor 2 family protein [Alphaproteobacteria bacterium]|mgnify:CR=1 FL=1|jgi:ketosteroid isomerase-like protein|nr:nuclear transport factor 2 family protein [Alphaproteobacteria bacterium]